MLWRRRRRRQNDYDDDDNEGSDSHQKNSTTEVPSGSWNAANTCSLRGWPVDLDGLLLQRLMMPRLGVLSNMCLNCSIFYIVCFGQYLVYVVNEKHFVYCTLFLE